MLEVCEHDVLKVTCPMCRQATAPASGFGQPSPASITGRRDAYADLEADGEGVSKPIVDGEAIFRKTLSRIKQTGAMEAAAQGLYPE